MTVTITPDTSVSTTTAGSLPRRAAKAGVLAAAAATAIAAVAHGLGVSFETAPGDAIPVLGFAQLTLFFTAIGALIARGLRNRSRHPHTTFVRTTIVLTVLSVLPDLAMSFDTGSKLTLMLTHVVAAAIVIPALASVLPEQQVG